MQTRLIEVVPDMESWPAWGARLIRKNPAKTIALASATPIVAVAAIPTAATLTGVAVVSVIADLWLSDEKIKRVQIKDALALRDPNGDAPETNRIYAFHPDRSRETLVIQAASFHSQIIGEQIAHLVAFIRSTVAAREIKISVFSENGATVAVTGPVQAEDLNIKAHAGSARHHSVELRYDEPEIVPSNGLPFWMKAFPEVVAAFYGATKGSVNRSVLIDTSFGLSASLAKSAGIDTNWLGRQRFAIDAKFG
ncbi:hypothetical protein [Novosphingobium pokkalii]|uniref:Uncharacterized protein n=1 Tax=Novosphingobium pokkalii TaxID=1770194 RepID=A0ABV7V6I4_9SPHN|nr:hypothetical protein [Novosphingobium pokkalii]